MTIHGSTPRLLFPRVLTCAALFVACGGSATQEDAPLELPALCGVEVEPCLAQDVNAEVVEVQGNFYAEPEDYAGSTSCQQLVVNRPVSGQLSVPPGWPPESFEAASDASFYANWDLDKSVPCEGRTLQSFLYGKRSEDAPFELIAFRSIQGKRDGTLCSPEVVSSKNGGTSFLQVDPREFPGGVRFLASAFSDCEPVRLSFQYAQR